MFSFPLTENQFEKNLFLTQKCQEILPRVSVLHVSYSIKFHVVIIKETMQNPLLLPSISRVLELVQYAGKTFLEMLQFPLKIHLKIQYCISYKRNSHSFNIPCSCPLTDGKQLGELKLLEQIHLLPEVSACLSENPKTAGSPCPFLLSDNNQILSPQLDADSSEQLNRCRKSQMLVPKDSPICVPLYVGMINPIRKHFLLTKHESCIYSDIL